MLICILVVFGGCNSGKIEKIQSRMDALSKELVPDSRTGICNVSLQKGKGRNLVLKGEVLSSEMKDSILAVAGRFHVLLTDSLTLLPDSGSVKKPWGLVTVSVANLRNKPAHSAEMVSQAAMGTPVRILKKKSGWLFIQTPDHYLSWTNTSSIQLFDDGELKKWKNSERLIFLGNNGTIQKELSGSEIISDLVAGSIVEKLSETAKFYQIALPDHRTGYISKENFRDFDTWKNSVGLTCENLCASAKTLLGFPYMWGGTSSKALDCSGFIKTVYFLNGIILERDASQQFKYGEMVQPGGKFENLQPCDLVFFGKKDPVRIVHVGMYLGDRKVINSSGWVQINSLDKEQPDFSDYLYDTFVGAKRFSNMKPQFGFMPVKEQPWY